MGTHGAVKMLPLSELLSNVPDGMYCATRAKSAVVKVYSDVTRDSPGTPVATSGPITNFVSDSQNQTVPVGAFPVAEVLTFTEMVRRPEQTSGDTSMIVSVGQP